MTPKEQEILQSLKPGRQRAPSLIGADDYHQVRAGKSGIAAHCPCCKTWFEVQDQEIHKHLLRKGIVELERAGELPLRHWLVSSWGLQLPPMGRGARLYTKSLGRIWQTGVSKGMRMVFKCARADDAYAHMGIAWNDGDVFGDNYFFCPAGELVEVIRRLMADAPLFRQRMKRMVEMVTPTSPFGFRDRQEDLSGLGDLPGSVSL